MLLQTWESIVIKIIIVIVSSVPQDGAYSCLLEFTPINVILCSVPYHVNADVGWIALIAARRADHLLMCCTQYDWLSQQQLRYIQFL